MLVLKRIIQTGSTAYLWLTNEILQIADQIVYEKKSSLRQGKDSVPTHIN